MACDWEKKLQEALRKMPSLSRINKARQRGDLSLELRAVARKIIERATEIEDKTSASLDDHTSLRSSLSCLNCNSIVEWVSLYCSDYCKQEAKHVRYTRKSIYDGKIKGKDVQDAIGVRFQMLSGGGYPSAERTISAELRKGIFERDQYTCQRCGVEATQIDHIDGSSNDPSNLQALCADCNLERVTENLTVITKETNPEEWVRLEQFYSSIALRIAAPTPVRICDDSDNWEKLWREILKTRRKLAPSKPSKP